MADLRVERDGLVATITLDRPEALNALKPDQRKNAVVKKVVQHFKDQDADLQKNMATRGLYRWGGTWVTEAQLARLKPLSLPNTLIEMNDVLSRFPAE